MFGDSNTYQLGTVDQRPWGCYEVLALGSHYVVKRISVNLGAKLSLQLHHGRNEHWTIVEGSARMTRGAETFDMAENDTVSIPAEVQHRIENIGAQKLVFIEVQYGEKLDEADIVRFDDIYNRIVKE